MIRNISTSQKMGICRGAEPSLVQMITMCRLFVVEPLPEPMLTLSIELPEMKFSNEIQTFSFKNIRLNISTAECKTAISPSLTHWRYCSLALSSANSFVQVAVCIRNRPTDSGFPVCFAITSETRFRNPSGISDRATFVAIWNTGILSNSTRYFLVVSKELANSSEPSGSPPVSC